MQFSRTGTLARRPSDPVGWEMPVLETDARAILVFNDKVARGLLNLSH
jgi:hypothetical protein